SPFGVLYSINYSFLTSGTVSAVSYQLPGGPSSGSFPDFYFHYYSPTDWPTDFSSLSSAVISATETILAAPVSGSYTDYFADVGNLAFNELADPSQLVQIQIGAATDANSEFADGPTAMAQTYHDTLASAALYGD